MHINLPLTVANGTVEIPNGWNSPIILSAGPASTLQLTLSAGALGNGRTTVTVYLDAEQCEQLGAALLAGARALDLTR